MNTVFAWLVSDRMLLESFCYLTLCGEVFLKLDKFVSNLPFAVRGHVTTPTLNSLVITKW